MFEKLKEIKEKKSVKIVGSILYALLIIVTVMILLVVLIQRFSDNAFSLAGYRVFTVVTGSMEPDYSIGDILLAREKPISEIEVGDDVVYLGNIGDFAGKIVTHRVIEINIDDEDGTKTFITKGIANDEQDFPIKGEQIIGVIAFNIVPLSFIGHIVQNLYSFYFAVFLPLGILVFLEIKRMTKNFGRN